MKKPFLVTACCLVLAVLLLQSGSIDWKDYLKGALNRTIDTVEDVFLRLKVKNPTLYKSFKQQSDALQAAINEYLEAHESQDDPNNMRYLERARELYKKLRDEQIQMRHLAQQQLDATDFGHLDKELQRLDQLLERFGIELNIHTAQRSVTVQTLNPEAVVAQAIAEETQDDKKQTVSDALKNVAVQVKSDLWGLTKQYATRKALDTFNTLDFNPTRASKGVVVDRSKELAANEKALIDSRANMGKRLGKAAEAQQKLFMEKVPKSDALRIGIVFSGGGYRAMTLSLGYAVGLAKMGVWDAASYISTLSGSTWFLSILMNIAQVNKGANSVKALEKTLDHLADKIKTDIFALARKEAKLTPAMKNFGQKDAFLSYISNVIWPKFLFQRPFRSVDIYGGLLAQTLLSGFKTADGKLLDPQIRRLSDEWEVIKEGDWPFPIRTAVTMTKENEDYAYHWFEFNPVEVRDIEIDLAVPMYSFGRSYSAGISVNQAPEEVKGQKLIAEYGPEERLGYLMGIWGSAYTVNLKDLQTMMKASNDAGGIADKAKAAVVGELLKALEKDTPIGAKRLSPAQVNNPFKLCGSDKCPKAIGSWVSEKDYLTLVDGGIAFNLPLPPLFKEQRELDVLIVGDSSGDIETTAQLDLFLKYIKAKQGLNYERIDDKKNATLGIWEVRGNAKAPLIIYINFKQDSKLIQDAQADLNLKTLLDNYKLAEYDYTKALAGFADTFNFDYKLDEFYQLYGIGEFNMRANEKVIMNLLRERWDKKRPPKEQEEEIVFGEWE